MAATLIGEWWDGREGSDGITRERSYTRLFLVRTDNAADDATVAGAATGVPRNGDAHPSDTAAAATAINATQMGESPYLWLVRVEYNTRLPTETESQTFDPATGESSQTPSPNSRTENPTQRPPSLTISQQNVKEIARWAYELVVDDGFNTLYDSTADTPTFPDAIGRVTDNTIEITNSAADPYDPPVEVEVMRDVITITDSVASISMIYESSLANALNADEWMGYPPRTLKVIANERASKNENGYAFWERRRSFAFNEDTWDIQVPDVGYREFIKGEPPSEGDPEAFPGTPDEWKPITTATLGREIQPPGAQLNGNGRLADADSEGTVYMNYRYFPEVEYGLLYSFTVPE